VKDFLVEAKLGGKEKEKMSNHDTVMYSVLDEIMINTN
jgi:hypothetical protein